MGGCGRVKTIVVLNPAAGSADDPEELLKKLKALPSAEVHVCAQPGDARKVAAAAIESGVELIVAAGGDGTLNEVINGVGENGSATRVALIPLGTGNDFARSIHLPEKVDDCLEVILAGRLREIDLVRVRSDDVRYFVNVSAGGFSGLVDEKLTAEIKQTWGPLAYLRCAAAALPELKAYETQIAFDDGPMERVSLYNLVIGNGRFVAGGIPVTPEAVLDDGLLDIILIPEKPKTELALLVAQILMGKHLGSETLIYKRAAKVTVNSQPGMWFNVDGELVGNEPAIFEVIPRGLQFIVGAE